MTDNYPPANPGYPMPPEPPMQGYGQASPQPPAYMAAQPGTRMPLYDPSQTTPPAPAPYSAPMPATQASPMPSPQPAPMNMSVPMDMPSSTFGAAGLSNPAALQQISPQSLPAAIATMGDRFLARLIDGVIIGAVAFVVSMIASFAGMAIMAGTVSTDPTTGEPNMGAVFGVLLGIWAIVVIPFVLYEVLCIGLSGATLGKKAMGLKVVDATTGERIGIWRAFLRYLIPTLAIIVFLIGPLIVYLSPFWDGENRNRGWHDKAVGDMVLKVRF